MFTMEVKENRKRDAAHIKILATSKATPVNSDSEGSIRVMRKNKLRNGILPSRKNRGKQIPKNHGT